VISVLFVCMGNICRSPMAEAVFRNLVHEAGLDHEFRIDSAGTTSYHVGDRAHNGTLKILAKHRIDYDGRSRRITRQDLDDFDYIVAMDNENLANIESLGASRGKVVRLLDFSPQQSEREVPDPYYDDSFDHVYELVLDGSKGLLTHIRTEHDLR